MYINWFTWIIFFHDCVFYIKNRRLRELSKFSQRNGKLPLPWSKQGNYPVIPIYGSWRNYAHDLMCHVLYCLFVYLTILHKVQFYGGLVWFIMYKDHPRWSNGLWYVIFCSKNVAPVYLVLEVCFNHKCCHLFVWCGYCYVVGLILKGPHFSCNVSNIFAPHIYF